MAPEQTWQLLDRFCELRNRWLTLIGEHLRDHEGRQLEYWRLEKDDSLIVLPLWAGRILLPAPSYRPGIGRCSLDLPGGRIGAGQDRRQAATAILQRELQLDPDAIASLEPLHADGWAEDGWAQEGWAVNSSFSNQRLLAVLARIKPDSPLPAGAARQVEASAAGVQALLAELDCLQCRAVLLQWWLMQLETDRP